MILSDVSIRKALSEGRIVIDPLFEGAIQPSSVDLRVDRYFRVFRNHTTPSIDPKQQQEDLTELVEVADEGAFILHPGEFVLGSTLERVALPDDLVARLEGKALALDTPVPTLTGWTTMGELAPGDFVFDDEGRPTLVTAVTEPMLDRPCREVVFSEGTRVVCDAAHLWRTVNKNGRRYGRPRAVVRTTDEIAGSLFVRGERNHQVPLAPPVESPAQNLPIDPYVLGAWLGDGTSTKAEITCADPGILAEIERAGYAVAPQRTRPLTYRIGGTGHSRNMRNGRYVRNNSLSSTLRDHNLLGNKHIPEQYLRSSVEQRKALLQGLMDTDGYVDKLGRCDFTSVRESLAESAWELVASLGLRPTLAKKRSKLNGIDHGPNYEVQFMADWPVFRLARKRARQKIESRFHRFRAIAAVREVPSVPVRCIQVAAESGMFLVTKSYVATHNSSLGRLGLLIHSSLPASETVLVLVADRLEPRPIGDVVAKKMQGFVVAFDPETFEIGYHAITGWYEGPADRIFEVQLASGRRVRVTAGHNLFTLDRDGALKKMRTGELRPGARVAVPHRIPDPPALTTQLDVLAVIPESEYSELTCSGPTVASEFAIRAGEVGRALRAAGYRHVDHYCRRQRLPFHVARQLDGLVDRLDADDRLSMRGARSGLPPQLEVDADVAWLLGLYVAEGYRRSNQFVVSNTDQVFLDRVEATLRRLGLPVYRAPGSITCCSSFASRLLGWIGTGGYAPEKRIPPVVFGWPAPLMQAFLDGLVDGDGSRTDERTNVWTTSVGLVGDLLLLCSRLGLRAGITWKRTRTLPLCQVSMPNREHKLLTSVPLPDHLLLRLRARAGMDQATAARAAGYKHATDLNNIERRSGRDAVRLRTLRRLRATYAEAADTEELRRLDRLVEGDLMWDEVVCVRDTGTTEPIFDLEVRPGGRKIENFVAGFGGVFVSNTAGFVDAGWDGHLTLELSNVANLPIAIYPGMRIGQISFLQMTTPAENPYGSGPAGSKYQGQRGPTPSRYYLNFTPKD